MTVYSDFITATIDGVDLSDYVITYSRTSSMCEPGQLFTLTMTRKKPDDSLISIDVADSVVLKEKYTGSPDTTLKGFVTSVSIDAENAIMTVKGADKYVLIADYFVNERLETSGQSVAYWIEYLCNLAELDVQFDSYPYIATEGIGDEEGTPLGMQSALDAIRLLERKGTVYTRYDSDLDKIVVYRLNSSEPQVNINSSNLLTFDRKEGKAGTRNVVNVWGGYKYDWITGDEKRFDAQARAIIPELIVDQTTVVASPEIKSLTFANIVANRILAVTAELDDLVMCECAGLYPAIKVGDWAYITISQGEISYNRTRQITSLGATVDTGGAQSVYTFGEKCPRISISPPLTPVYVTDTDDGVGISWDAGESFTLSNVGLTGDALHGKSVAVNNYGRGMTVTAGGLYKRFSDMSPWYQVINLPDPTNESNDPSPLGITNLDMIKVVDEPLKPYTFHMVASGANYSGGWYRSYVYSTKDYGYTWNTTQMWVPAVSGELYDPAYQEHSVAPSGRVYDVFTHDMVASLGNEVYTLVSSPFVAEDLDPDAIYVLKETAGNTMQVIEWDGGSTPVIQEGVATSGYICQAKLWSAPTNTDVCYLGIIANDGVDSTYNGAITYVWRTNDGGDNWDKVHEELFISHDVTTTNRDNYTVNFDPASTEAEVRLVFTGWNHTGGVDTTDCHLRFINSIPTGSTTRTDSSVTSIPIPPPSLGGGETRGGYNHQLNAYNGASKHASVADYTWCGSGYYSPIYSPTRTDTGVAIVWVRARFSTKTGILFNSMVWRTGNTSNGSPRTVLHQGITSNSVEAFVTRLPGQYLLTSSSATPKGSYGGLGLTDFAYTTYHNSVTWRKGGYPDYYTYIRDRDGNETISTWEGDTCGWLNRAQGAGINRQTLRTNYEWAFSASTAVSDPEGFCWSDDGGLTWTQHWSLQSLSPTLLNAVWDFAFKDYIE